MTDSPDSTREWYADKQEERIEHLESENVRLQRAHDLMLANLTATQARCTELLEENRELRAELQEATRHMARVFELMS